MPLKECCADEENRTEPLVVEDAVDGNTWTVCKICMCRHYRAVIDPFHIGITPSGG